MLTRFAKYNMLTDLLVIVCWISDVNNYLLVIVCWISDAINYLLVIVCYISDVNNYLMLTRYRKLFDESKT